MDWSAILLPDAAVVLAALAIDAAVGDPARLYRLVPHPVVLIGRAIDSAERALNRADLTRTAGIARGAALVGGLVLAALAAGWGVAYALAAIPGGWVVGAVLASAFLAGRGLHDHVKAVAEALDAGLAEGRDAVSHIVGRSPESLDRPGVARAAIESAAENFSDGMVAPVFWFLVGGLPGLVAYKTINTLDSMIGHRSPRFEAFGKAAAKLDDIVNWPAARLAGGLIVAATAIRKGARSGRAWRTMLRDAPRHRSPNAGWPEAAMAGALGFALAGPRRYGDRIVDDAWMGDGRADLDAADIRAALALYRSAWGALAAVTFVVGIIQFVRAVAVAPA